MAARPDGFFHATVVPLLNVTLRLPGAAAVVQGPETVLVPTFTRTRLTLPLLFTLAVTTALPVAVTVAQELQVPPDSLLLHSTT